MSSTNAGNAGRIIRTTSLLKLYSNTFESFLKTNQVSVFLGRPLEEYGKLSVFQFFLTNS